MVRIVCFDLDDTLWHCGDAIGRAEVNMRAWLNDRYPGKTSHFDCPVRFAALREGVYKNEARELAAQCRLLEVRRLILVKGLTLGGATEAEISEGIEDAVAYYLHQRSACIEPFPECERMLQDLVARQYTLCALTNGNANLETVNLHEYFALH
eukprot:gene12877-19852_t